MEMATLPTGLEDVAVVIPTVIFDIRYATTNNFTSTQLYEQPFAWLRHEPLTQLKKATDDLQSKGYKLVMFDAFRPVVVQEKLRAVVNDENFVKEVSNHCRGITVDVTLADLDMGTEYDDFTEKARPDSDLIDDQQRRNRQLLSNALEQHGFTQHSHEWWHFDYKPERAWPVITDQINVY